jgi:hypothetical protein
MLPGKKLNAIRYLNIMGIDEIFHYILWLHVDGHYPAT